MSDAQAKAPTSIAGEQQRVCRWCGATEDVSKEFLSDNISCINALICRDRLSRQLKEAHQLIANLQSGGAIEGTCRLVSERLWKEVNTEIVALREMLDLLLEGGYIGHQGDCAHEIDFCRPCGCDLVKVTDAASALLTPTSAEAPTTNTEQGE